MFPARCRPPRSRAGRRLNLVLTLTLRKAGPYIGGKRYSGVFEGRNA